jgi:IMP dehydrogenase
MKLALSFDDVLLLPRHSTIPSRKDVDTSTQLAPNLLLKIPVIASCMDTVCEDAMAIAMWRLGGLGIIHRYNTIEKQVELYQKVQLNNAHCAVAVGATGDYLDRMARLYDAGCRIICIDIANGDSEVCGHAVKTISKLYKDITIIAGNVSTGVGARFLIESGAHIIRIGIGSGSLCTTRINTGCGAPTLYSLFECIDTLAYSRCSNYSLIADGGIKNGGDIVKSIAAGANGVMLGQLLAATDEAPGEIISTADGKYKRYQGMASYASQVAWRPDKKDEIVPEGEATLLPCKGAVDKIIYQLVGGLRSGMTYNNATNLQELKNHAEFIRITGAGWQESMPHAKR